MSRIILHIEVDTVAASPEDTPACIRRSISWFSTQTQYQALDSAIRSVFGLSDSVRFILYDENGNVVVLDSSIPSNTTLYMQLIPGDNNMVEFIVPNPIKRRSRVSENQQEFKQLDKVKNNLQVEHNVRDSEQENILKDLEAKLQLQSVHNRSREDLRDPTRNKKQKVLVEHLEEKRNENMLFRIAQNLSMNPSKWMWRRILSPEILPRKRWGHQLVFTGKENRVYLYGGSCEEFNLSDVHLFDYNKKCWIPLYKEDDEVFARSWSSVTYVESLKGLLIVGGETSAGECASQLLFFNLGNGNHLFVDIADFDFFARGSQMDCPWLTR